jgi:hypothetical protein
VSFAPPQNSLEPGEVEPYATPPKAPQIGKLTAAEREAALRTPGQSWSDWLYGVALKWWIGLAILIIDSWIVAGWAEVGGWPELAGSIALAVYLEYLLFQYLWHPYEPELHGKFRPTWKNPFEVGRWTPERKAQLAGTLEASTPDPHQFL